MVGAGGIGCELLKNLSLWVWRDSHCRPRHDRSLEPESTILVPTRAYQEIESIGTIEIWIKSNNVDYFVRLPRKPRSSLTRTSTSQRITQTSRMPNLQSMVPWIWNRFNALDNLEARRHVNRMCLAADVPLIESGTTGFNGQVQVIKKGKTACYDCTAKEVPKSFPSAPSNSRKKSDDPDPTITFDKDDEDTLDFVTASANIRSAIFGIDLKSRFDIKQMAGNIIPAIATTNAIVAGLCVLEAFKVLKGEYDQAKEVFLTPFAPARLLAPDRPRDPNAECAICGVFSTGCRGVTEGSFLTVIDESDDDAMVNIVLSIESGRCQTNQTSFTSTPAIPRKLSKPAPAETNGNGVHANVNGVSEANATQGHKRSRSGDDGQPPKKARLGDPHLKKMISFW
ncbi:hypothetical protein GIB67_000065 [Kingdonia uniflora]|uniref:THIF-type NAD/FAD binding fold domain-containing protein n=1 Tax=Kingdonia uniflora TaxID=39325 RepID=A0A7J7NVQ0_9MAGN|nr:hypothetical protein GIB67_000065 [Kingdonia uniflora]